MLTSRHRLRREEDFIRCYRRGRFASSGWLMLRVCPGARGLTRFGIVVPNAVVRRAVDRNRIRRQLRALITAHLATLPRGYDWVLQVRAIPPRAMPELRAHFHTLLARISLPSQKLIDYEKNFR